MKHITSKDIIAFITIIGLILFKLTGHNGSLDLAVASIVGFYFGSRS